MSDGDLVLVDDQTGGRLGRNVIWHDPANREYPARGVMFGPRAKILTKLWSRRGVFDQGLESSCTMQAAVGVLMSSPFGRQLPATNRKAFDTAKERHAAYKRAQKFDPWPGENYDGCSTDAPYKLLREEKAITEWRWCFGLKDVLRTLSHHGPVSIGTDWHEGMEEPNSKGFVIPAGEVLGGHAYELVGVNTDQEFVTAVNSWGTSWGKRGRFRLSWDDLENLLEKQGEACTVVV